MLLQDLNTLHKPTTFVSFERIIWVVTFTLGYVVRSKRSSITPMATKVHVILWNITKRNIIILKLMISFM